MSVCAPSPPLLPATSRAQVRTIFASPGPPRQASGIPGGWGSEAARSECARLGVLFRVWLWRLGGGLVGGPSCEAALPEPSRPQPFADQCSRVGGSLVRAMNELIFTNILSFLLLGDDAFANFHHVFDELFLDRSHDDSLTNVDRFWKEVRQLAFINRQALRLVRRSCDELTSTYTHCLLKWAGDAPGTAWELAEYDDFCEMAHWI